MFHLLYFASGLFEDTYDEEITYTALAGRITHWTKLLPQAVPVATPRHLHTTAQTGPIEWVNCGSLLERVRVAVRWGVNWLGGVWRERFGGEFILRDGDNSSDIINTNNTTPNSSNSDNSIGQNSTDVVSDTQSESIASQPNSKPVSAGTPPPPPSTPPPQSSLPIWERDLFLPFPHSNIEPFVGSKLDAVYWDRGMFVVSGLYAFARLVMWYAEMKKRRGRDEDYAVRE
eukprot:gene30956-38256_t